MKTKSYIAVLFALLFSSCATTPPRSDLVYGLSEPDLQLLGRRLGFRVEDLGMFDFRFSRGSRSFHVFSHLYIGSADTIADSPLGLYYRTDKPVSRTVADKWNRDAGGYNRITTAVAGRKDDDLLSNLLRSNLLLDGGVSRRAVDLHFRRFISEIDAFEKQLQ